MLNSLMARMTVQTAYCKHFLYIGLLIFHFQVTGFCCHQMKLINLYLQLILQLQT